MKGRIERRGDRWRVITEAGVGADGKRARVVHTMPAGALKKDAERELRRRLQALDEGGCVSPAKQLLSAYLRDWLAGPAKMRVSAKTWQEYQGWVEGRIIPALGQVRLDQLTAARIQGAWAALMEGGRKDGKKGAGLSSKSIRNLHGILRTALETAVRDGLLPKNPCDLADLPRSTRTPMRVLEAAQINTLLEAAKGRTLYVPILLAVTTGMRRGEILALQWSDVDLDAGILTVARATEQTRAHGVRIKETKTGAVRKIQMPALLIEELRRYRQETGRIAGPVVCTQDGRSPLPTSITATFGVLIRKLDLPPVRFHDLRHSAATLLLSLGMPLSVVSEILGHSDPATTLRIYAHVLPAFRTEAAEAMDRALKKAQGS